MLRKHAAVRMENLTIDADPLLSRVSGRMALLSRQTSFGNLRLCSALVGFPVLRL